MPSPLSSLPAGAAPRRVAVCFFGLNRSLSRTWPSLERTVYAPLRAHGVAFDVFAAFMQPAAALDNPRTGEVGCRPEAHSHVRLGARAVALLPQDAFDRTFDFAPVAAAGDAWGDEWRSARNLCRALHSLAAVKDLADAADAGGTAETGGEAGAYELWIFLRADLWFHDPLPWVEIAAAWRRHGERLLMTPCWALYGGLNDRFAVAGRVAAEVYGRRLARVPDYVRAGRGPLHAERLLQYAAEGLVSEGVYLPVRASRVRADGRRVNEKFRNRTAQRYDAATARRLYWSYLASKVRAAGEVVAGWIRAVGGRRSRVRA